MTERQVENVRIALRSRRADAPFDELYAEMPGEGSADLRATAIVVALLSRRP